MKYKGYDIKGDFRYVCERDDGKVDEFTIFANILDEAPDTLTINYYMKFGELDCGIKTIQRESFEKYYNEIIPEKVKEKDRKRTYPDMSL